MITDQEKTHKVFSKLVARAMSMLEMSGSSDATKKEIKAEIWAAKESILEIQTSTEGDEDAKE